MDAVTAFVGLGANEGDRAAALRTAIAALDATDGLRVEGVSPVYQTEAHRRPGQPPQPDHLNAVVRLRTALPPDALLDVFHALEAVAGRAPTAEPWAPRPLDLDLLLYGDRVMVTPALTLPHPRLAGRRFVLRPLADLAPNLVLPDTGATVADALAACADPARVDATSLILTP